MNAPIVSRFQILDNVLFTDMILDPKHMISIKSHLRSKADLIHFMHKFRKLDYSEYISTGDFGRLTSVVSEIATNIVRYAGSGKLKISIYKKEKKLVTYVTAIDEGPGIENIQLAFTRGFSSRGSLGLGMPMIAEVLRNLRVKNLKRGGLVIAGIFKLDNYKESNPSRLKKNENQEQIETSGVDSPTAHFELGMYSQPHPGEHRSGDLIFHTMSDAGLVVCIYDGLGHGQLAYESAKQFQNVTLPVMRQLKKFEDFAKSVRLVDESFEGSRSGVAAFACLSEQNTIQFCSIGNISAALFGPVKWSPNENFGVFGDGAITKNIETLSFIPGSTLVMYTDGLKEIYMKDIQLEGRYSSAQNVAQRLHAKKRRGYDDSSIIVVKQHQ